VGVEKIGALHEAINDYNLKKVYHTRANIIEHPELSIPQFIM
jgi:ABC-type cobalamin/Fe3+-siderophores transport system ATPase subunit